VPRCVHRAGGHVGHHGHERTCHFTEHVCVATSPPPPPGSGGRVTRGVGEGRNACHRAALVGGGAVSVSGGLCVRTRTRFVQRVALARCFRSPLAPVFYRAIVPCLAPAVPLVCLFAQPVASRAGEPGEAQRRAAERKGAAGHAASKEMTAYGCTHSAPGHKGRHRRGVPAHTQTHHTHNTLTTPHTRTHTLAT
jgi:hypothetical protein